MDDKILDIIRNKGPILPSDLAKQLKTNTMFIGAHLSEMVSSKKLIVSHLKIGSSPLYYLPGQQSRLQVFYKHLNDKDRKAFDLLKERKVLRDRSQQPIIRVALRSIKDFATPLNVNAGGEREVFWKWYLLDDKEAEPLIRKYLEVGVQKQAALVEDKKKLEEERKKKEEEKAKIESEKKEAELLRQEREEEKNKAAELKKQIEAEKVKLEEEKRILEEEKRKNEEDRKKIEEEKKNAVKKETSKKDEQKTLKEEVKKEPTTKETVSDSFLDEIKGYCSKNKIEIIESKIIKKKTDLELIIKVPSVVGEVTYFCKARDKKRISDGDLSSALVKGQLKKLPALFLSKGDLTKKAQQELEGDLKNHIIFKKM